MGIDNSFASMRVSRIAPIGGVSGERRTKRKGGADMAKVTKRTWYSTSPTGQRQKRVAWGFTTQGADGKQIRRSDTGWTREEAEKALAEHRLGLGPKGGEATGLTFGAAVERYLQAKSRKR